MLSLRTACFLFHAPSQTQSGQLSEWAEACFRFTPQIAVSKEAIFLEIGKCGQVYKEEGLKARFQALSQRFTSNDFRWAIAPDAPTALAFARNGTLGTGSSEEDIALRARLPVEALRDYVDPFGVEREDWNAPVFRLITTLEKLGVSRVGEFLEISPEKLPSRFGKLGILLHQRVRNAQALAWPRFSPPERVTERGVFEAEETFRELEPLLFALTPVMDRAMGRLRGRGQRASSVRLSVELERYSSLKVRKREWIFTLALPQGSASSLLPILRERLSAELEKKPLMAPVTELEFEILESAPGRSSQRGFFGNPDEEIEAWNSLLSRLVEKLGEDRVFQARLVPRHLPEKAWEKTLQEVPTQEIVALPYSESHRRPVDAPALWLMAERPLRLFKKPVPLEREGDLLCLEGKPLWKARSVEGPEITSGEWWFGEPQRNYFRMTVESDDGKSVQELWVYRLSGSEKFFLHGVFD